MPDTETSLWVQEMEKATRAYTQKRYGDARAHLVAAKKNGASLGTVQKFERVIKTAEEQQAKLRRNCGTLGFFLAIFCLTVLAFLPVSNPVRFVLLLGVIPAACGFVMGRLAGYDFGAGSRFRRAGRVAAFTVFWYALIGMIWSRTRFGLGSEAGQVFLVWLTASAVYAIIAGLVAGFAGGKLAWLTSGKGDAHGTAS